MAAVRVDFVCQNAAARACNNVFVCATTCAFTNAFSQVQDSTVGGEVNLSFSSIHGFPIESGTVHGLRVMYLNDNQIAEVRRHP